MKHIIAVGDRGNMMEYQYIDLNDKNIVRLDYASTSKGNQIKYYDNLNHHYIKLPFYYQGVWWKDYMVENLSNVLAEMLDTLDVKIVRQTVCMTSENKYAVVSQDFCADGSEWISFRRFCNLPIYKDKGRAYKVYTELLNAYKSICDTDIENYLIVMIVMDFLLLNEDRHFNNFGILSYNGEFATAPLFDFGLGLFEHDMRYNGKSLTEALALTECKPFSSDASEAINMLVNIGKSAIIKKIIKDIEIPDNALFPSELAYEYFKYAVNYLCKAVK
jgi:hypothetical protein